MKPPRVQPTLFSCREVAQITGLSLVYVRELVRRRELPAFLLGQAYRIHVDDLNRWLNAHRVERPAPEAAELDRWWERSPGPETEEGSGDAV